MGTTYPEECGASFLKGTSRYPSTYDPPFIHPPRFAEGSRTVGLLARPQNIRIETLRRSAIYAREFVNTDKDEKNGFNASARFFPFPLPFFLLATRQSLGATSI